MLKSHSCGELNRNNNKQIVTLGGWVDRRRDHGGLIFIDLRDREGVVQVVFNPESSKECHDVASQLRNEYVVQVVGQVYLRPPGTENIKLPTGEIEILADSVKILNTSKTPPFYINEDIEIDESLRLKYRYLDIRRERMKNNVILRHRVTKMMRDFMDNRGFLEVETPILIKRTPEGARDYLVPSRVYPGKFYALPQSPQQLKQLLMVAGIEKYYQVAKCFRDEDTRADRQPEFTQLDIEMSFAEEEDVMQLIEDLFVKIMEELKPQKRIIKPFPRLNYADAMERFGSDKPDIRFGMEIKDLSDIVADCEFAVFSSAVAAGGKVKGISAPGCAGYSRAQINELNEMAQGFGAKGLATIILDSSVSSIEQLTPETIKSQISKFLTLEQIKNMAKRLGAAPGDMLMIAAGDDATVSNVLGRMRLEMGNRLKLADPDLFAYCFVVNFPLFTWDDKTNRWEAMHHPFTSPKEKDIPILESNPKDVFSQSYDIILNGYEVGGGSIRIHNAELQRRVFKVMGHTDESIDQLFGHLLEAFSYGAPPHGGIAIGVDRMLMLIAGENSIREVIPFPKNQNAYDLCFNAPDVVSREDIDVLHIKLLDEQAEE
ncbi:MAG TPA: aspartate--tRNA ligase [Dehalococcoidia bacterium]|nr:aspartate--tRNA ligase [Dehalococcoidia bacterium]